MKVLIADDEMKVCRLIEHLVDWDALEMEIVGIVNDGKAALEAGVQVEDYDPLLEKTTQVSGVFGKGTASMWCDVIRLDGAKALGVYTSDYYCGQPCFTVNQVGKGKVYYVGCDLDEDAMKLLVVYLGRAA